MNLWVFDNDGTLYDDLGAGEQFQKIFNVYFAELLNISPKQVVEEVVRLKEKWSTEFSILGLVREYGVDFNEVVNNTYLKIDLTACRTNVPDLLRLRVISSLKGEKIVLTNNPSNYAQYVLSHIGLRDCFSTIVGMQETGFLGKPNSKSYQTVENLYPKAKKITFCDDSLQNLDAAYQRGWTTVWFKPSDNGLTTSEKHLVISSFEELLSIE